MKNIITKSNVNQCVFMTEKGYMGQADLGISPGDLICIFYGSKQPFILRPMGSSGVAESWYSLSVQLMYTE